MNIMKKSFAFTLAEVLVVLGIIGVVSAITLPNLSANTNNKEKVVQVKKIYSNLQDISGRATAIYGPVGTWGLGSNTDNDTLVVANKWSQFIKGTKIQYFGKYEEKVQYRYVNGTNFTISSTPYSYELDDGTFLSIYSPTAGNINICADIDGAKGRHIVGEDVFCFNMFKSDNYDIKPTGNTTDDSIQNCVNNGTSCTGWVIRAENMDYIKQRANKCKAGSLSSTVLSCE